MTKNRQSKFTINNENFRAMWVLILIALVFVFKLHTRLIEMTLTLPDLVNNLSPKFYVALTGTSSFLSGKT